MSEPIKLTGRFWDIDIEDDLDSEPVGLHDIEDDLDRAPVKETPTVKHDCSKCGGSGRYTFGFINPRQGKCFACKGKGHFLTSAKERQKGRDQRQQRKIKNEAANLELFKEQEPAAYDWLVNATGEFPQSLLNGIRQYGSLTEGQLRAVYNCIARDEDRAKARAEAAEAAVKLNLSAVFERFTRAVESGLSKPRLRVPGFRFSLAPPQGRNAGHLYVKGDADEYLGKVAPSGEFFKSRECTAEQVAELQSIAADVIAAARAFGHAHGQCGMCSRELTDPVSIALGYGPICADHWGFPHDEDSARAINPEFWEKREQLKDGVA